MLIWLFFFFFSSRRRHTRCREVSWARRCVQETVSTQSTWVGKNNNNNCRIYFCYRHVGWIYNDGNLSSLCRKGMLQLQAIFNILHLLHGFFHLHIFALHHHHLISVSYTHLTLPTILLVQISVVAVSLKKKKNNKKIIIQ
eukprot:TRINITY_DN7215_c0_g1_i3.p1 TRINITY_DN7215_c0_g1~~TRINITY_DN7215_c0_g1_i3.p1  ORF type:complete len:141 (+),score=47.49 TRINITY_DN7215_c0_g1_i3:76-498(+)